MLISRQKQVQNDSNEVELILVTSVTDFYKSRFFKIVLCSFGNFSIQHLPHARNFLNVSLCIRITFHCLFIVRRSKASVSPDTLLKVHNARFCYGEEVLAMYPFHKRDEDHLFPALSYCLYSIFVATIHM